MELGKEFTQFFRTINFILIIMFDAIKPIQTDIELIDMVSKNIVLLLNKNYKKFKKK